MGRTRAAGYRLVIAALLALSGAIAGTVGGRADSLPFDDRDEHECVSSFGYWKNHTSWPVRTLVLGDPRNAANTYTQTELLRILETSASDDDDDHGGHKDDDRNGHGNYQTIARDNDRARADASIILAHQLIAARLNVARGSNPAPIASSLDAADRLLSVYRGKLPYRVAPNTPAGASMVSIADLLEDYNEGRIRGACRSPVNAPPAANAGPDQTVALGATVRLDGSRSSDANGDPLTFTWAFVSKPASSAAVLTRPTSVTPTFVADTRGTYVLQLVVSDGRVNSTADTVRVSTENSRPVANAGPDRSLPLGATARLDGSASTDADGDTLTFAWSFVSRPDGSAATLFNQAAIDPAFVLDLPGTYVVQLVVRDGALASAPDTVTVSTINSAPRANAGPDRTVPVQTTVTLDGTASSDPDGDALTFRWSLLTKPAASQATLANAAGVAPTILIDAPGDYIVQLIVNDSHADSAPDTVRISTTNTRPVANAGSDAGALVGDVVTLDGSGSTDLDGNPLTYVWALTTRPAGSVASLSSGSAVKPTITVDAAGDYIAQLIVNDGTVDSAPDTVRIAAAQRNQPPTARPGANQTVPLGATAQLDGSASSDPDGDPLTFRWSLLSVPDGSTTMLSAPASATPTFAADKPGSYIAQLIVNDGTFDSAPKTVTISTTNSVPTANAGPDQTVASGATAQLDGTASFDPDGTPLQYTWSLLTRPDGSTAVIDSPDAAAPTFVADLDGVYVAQLMVSDGTLVSAADTVTVTAQLSADLQLTFTGPPRTTPAIGDVSDLSIQILNMGAAPTSGVKVLYRIPAGYTPGFFGTTRGTYDPATGIWDIGDLADFDGAFLFLNGTVGSTGPYDLHAEVSASSAPDPDHANNSVNATVTINGNADLAVSFITFPTGTIVPGDTVQVFLQARNDGPSSTSNAKVHFVLPPGFVPIGSPSFHGAYDPATGVWDLGSIPLNGLRNWIAFAIVQPTGSTVLTASVTSSDQPDPNPANNTATAPRTNRRPVSNAGPDQSAATNTTVTLDGRQTFDPEGDPVTYQWTFAMRPANSTATIANATTASPTFVPDLGGTYILSLVATDNQGAVSVADTVSIAAAVLNHAPVIRTKADTVAAAGTAYRYEVRATDPDAGDVLTFSLPAAPQGMTIDPSTGVVAWTPAADQGGVQSVTVRVTDAGGLFATQTFAIQVSSAGNRAPVANPDAYSVRLGESLAVGAPGVLRNDTDAEGHPLTTRLLTQPANGTVGLNADGSFTYTPFRFVKDEFVLAENIPLTTRVPGVTIAASSNETFGGGCPNVVCAIDDSDATSWYNNDFSPFIEVTFPQDVTVAHVQIRGDRAALSFRPRKVTAGIIELRGADGGLLFTSGNVELPLPLHDVMVDVPNVAAVRRVRFTITATTDGFLFDAGIAEFRVIGSTLLARRQTLEANLAQLLPTSVQASSFVPNNPPDSVVDDAPTNWYANSPSPGEFVELAFPADITVNRIHTFIPTATPDGFGSSLPIRCAGVFTLLDAAGASLFATAEVATPNSDVGQNGLSVSIPNVAGVRRVRYTTTTCAGSSFPVGFSEIQVFGSAALDVPPLSVAKRFQVLTGREAHSTPIVVNLTDDNGDGRIDANDIPDIIVPVESSGNQLTGDLKAVSGDDGHELFTAGVGLVSPWSEVAAADLDGDGVPEIVAVHSDGNHLIAFDHTGAVKWISDANPMPRFNIGNNALIGGAISIANLDRAGPPEIVVGASVFDAAGHLIGDGRALGGTTAGTGLRTAVSAIGDIDLDGVPEIVAGPTAYRLVNGALTKVWQRTDRPDGFVAIANMDDDPQAEIAVVAQGTVYVLNHDGSDAATWNAPSHAPVAIPGGGQGGAPLVVDVDGDGLPEIGVAAASRYVLFNRDGTVRWSQAITDRSSNSTGAIAFDLDGDGSVEIIYRDERYLRVFRGADGVLLAKVPVGSATWGEEPVVADVDNDGHADIVVSSDFFTQSIGVQDTGILVFNDFANKWTRTRRIWNEHAYHVTNVNEDGSIPVSETPHWLASGLNGFRVNQFVPGESIDAADCFAYAASDGVLESTTTVRIAIRPTNSPPAFTSSPIVHGANGVSYIYAARASDPDPGDILTFSLSASPAGMTIDPVSGVIAWTPASDQRGTHDVVVLVRDVHGLTALQPYSVEVGDPATVPDVVGQPRSTAATALAAAALTVGAVSTRHSPTVAADAVISQTPAAGTRVAPAARVSLVVSLGPAPAGTVPDVVGQTQVHAQIDIGAAGFVVGVVLGENSATVPSGTVIAQSPAAGAQATSGSAVALRVSLGPPPGDLDLDHDGFTGNGGDCNDTNASIHPGAVDIPGDGIDQDCNGRDAVAGDTTPPTASLQSPAENTEITLPTDIIGSVADANFLRYTLQLVRAGTTAPIVIGAGAAPVAGGALGRIDPTLLENGIYLVRLTAEDVNGQVQTVERPVVVEGAAKIGVFRVTFKDVSVPVAGVPVTVFRTYDSRVKTGEDFGVGWTLDVKRGFYEHSRTPGEAWQILAGGLGLPCRTVSETASHLTQVRLSDYEFYTFALTLTDPRPLTGGCEATARFQAVGGRRSGATLEILDGTDVLYLNGDSQIVYPDTFAIYNPSRVRLSTVDGRIFDFERQKGITRIQDINGNTLSISNAGIVHASGKSLSFTRDDQGRIVRTTDPLGQSLAYTYDEHGDLVRLVDQAGVETTYFYDTQHNLLRIVDPTGRTGLTSEYDADGRLIAVADAAGHRTTVGHDIDARTDVVTDARGNASVAEYDERGNVVKRTDPLGHTTRATFDARDNTLSQTDELGRTWTYAYDASDNVTTRTDPAGHTATFTYDAQNRVTSMTDAGGGITTFQYDAAGNLVEQHDPAGRLVRGTYDAHGLLATVANEAGVLMTNTRDAFGQIVEQTDGLGHVSTFTYDANGHQISQNFVVTDAAGHASVASSAFQLDGRDRLSAVVDPSGSSVHLTYDAHGQLGSTTDHLGVETRYEYDLSGNRVRTIRADGAFEETAYDENGNQTRRTDPAGRTVRFEYDAMNRLARVIHADGTDARNTYDAAGQLVRVVDEKGAETTFEYDALGRRTKTTDATGGVSTDDYDELGRVLQHTDPNGHVTRYEYSAAGQRSRIAYPDGGVVTFGFDAVGNVTSMTDQEGRATRYEYDVLGRLIKVTDALGNVTRYQFNERGDMTTQTDPNGHVTRWDYDGSRRVIGRTLPLGMRESYDYNGNGQLIAKTDFNGRRSTFAYADNQLVGATYPDASGATFTYGPDGRRASMTDATGTTTYAYDDRGRLSQVTTPDGAAVSYAFDAADNLITVTSPSGDVRHTYDAANRLASTTDPDGGVTRFTRDPAGNAIGVAYPNGVSAQYDYDSRDRPTSMVYRDSHATELMRLGYAYSPTGRRLSLVEGSGRRVDYGYDALYRLTSEQTTDPVGGSATRGYTYDAVGNRLSSTGPGGVSIYSYDANDRILTAGPTLFSYDLNGNVVGKTGGGVTTAFGYDDRNHLRSVTAGSSTSTFTYDGEGVRVGATINGTASSYVQDRMGLPAVLEERDAEGGLIASYVRGSGLVSEKRSGLRSFYLPDALGSTRALTSASGAVTDAYVYDGFGNLQARTGTTANDFQFAGEQFDRSTGLYHLRARAYDPVAGRFTGSDPVPPTAGDPRTLHRYAYCASDPLNCVDPTGREGEMISLSIAASVAGVLASVAVVSQAQITARVFTLHSAADYLDSSKRSARLAGLSVSGAPAPLVFETGSPQAKLIAFGLAPFSGMDGVDVLTPLMATDTYLIYPYFGVSISCTNWLPSNLAGSLTGTGLSAGGYLGYAFQVHEPGNYLGSFISASVNKLAGKMEGFGGLPYNAAIFSDPSGSKGAYGWSVGFGTSSSFSLAASYTYYPTVYRVIPENIARQLSESEALDFARYALGMSEWR